MSPSLVVLICRYEFYVITMQVSSVDNEKIISNLATVEGMRIVSLVPSLTLTLFDLGLTSNEIVGRTPWCIHPAEKVSEVMVVGGTKTPNLNKIRNLKPDLIVMDKDENPLKVYEQLLSEGFKIFVSEVEHPNDVPHMLKELGEACGKAKQGEIMAQNCTMALMNCSNEQRKFTTIPLIWYQPIMAVSPVSYTHLTLPTR